MFALRADTKLNTDCGKCSQTWLEGEDGDCLSEEKSERERANTSPVSERCMDSQIQTGNSLIPLAQFLSGSHIAGNRDMKALH